mgnify:CR=1 FL=1
MTALGESIEIKAKEVMTEYLYTTVQRRRPKNRGRGQKEKGEAEGGKEEQGRRRGNRRRKAQAKGELMPCGDACVK